MFSNCLLFNPFFYKKGGYKDRLALSTLIRPEDKGEYAGTITDEQFANFRAVATSGMGKNILYRSSSPIDNDIGRNAFADALAEETGVQTFINLSDTESKASAYPGFSDSYYSGQNVIYCSLPASFTTESFSDGFAKALRYLTEHEGPYLIHCTEGKDRAGFVAAVLEFFMGASLDEVEDDYLISYENYYAELKDGGVQLNDDMRELIRNIIKSNIGLAYGIDDISSVDMRKASEDYLRSIGLKDEELSALRKSLSSAD